MVFTSSVEIMQMWATRRRAYRKTAKAQMLQATIGESVKLGFGLIGLQPAGLILGYIIGQASSITSFLIFFRQDLLKAIQKVSWRRICIVAGIYKGFPTYRLAAHVLMTLSGQSLIFFAASYYNSEITGQLGMAVVALALPLTLIGISVGNALYGEAAVLGHRKPLEIKQLILSTSKRLSILALAPTLLLMLFGPELFALILGAKWEQSGIFASIFSVFLILQFVTWPIIKVLNIFNEQWIFLEINLLRVLLLLLCYVSTWILELNVVAMVVIYSVILCIHYIYTFVRIMSFIDTKVAIQK